MLKVRNYKLTKELLDNYQSAALINAQQLVDEASLLLEKEHYARAYFLSLASIEETGKAQISFDAKGRNLNDGGLCTKVKENLESHSDKITSAFIAWMSYASDPREAVKKSVELMVQLKFGREKSMYTDVKPDGNNLSIPSEVVRPTAAKDCLSLAINCLHHAKYYFENNSPNRRNSYEDKLMCIKKKTMTAMLRTEDFWEYYIDRLEQGKDSYAMAVVTYHDGYYKKSKLFKAAS